MEPTTAEQIRAIMKRHNVSESTARRWHNAGRSKPGNDPGHPRKGNERRVQAAVRAYYDHGIPFEKALKKSRLKTRTFRRRIQEYRDRIESLSP